MCPHILGLVVGSASTSPQIVDWVEVAELMETSYRQVALKRMLKVLDAG
jgi:hypothetical protein